MTVENFQNNKGKLIKSFAINNNDTGSSSVQIALITAKIEYLVEHIKLFSKDLMAKRSLLRLVTERIKLLNYLKRTNYSEYEKVTEKLKLKKK